MFDNLIILLLLLVIVGNLIITFILHHLHRVTIATMVDYYRHKSERAKKFADNEDDEDKKMTYRALQNAWEKAEEVARRGIYANKN